jgi:Tfp pilus assembly protein PilF
MTWRCGLTRILRSLGRDFLVCTRFFTLTAATNCRSPRCGKGSFRKCAETATEHARNPALHGLLSILGAARLRLAKATFERVSKKLPGNSEVLYALAAIARSEGHWDESVAYWERGLALNPRNTALLTEVAFTYAAIRQFPKAEKLYDRALNILPNELSLMALKASIYQAEGNLQESAKLLAQVNAETNSDVAVRIKLTQWRLERNHTEATRWVQARQDRLRLVSGIDKGSKQLGNALVHRVAGDSTQAKAFAEQARNTIEPLRKEQPDNAFVAAAWLWLTPCSTRRNQPSTKRSAQSRFRRATKIGYLDPLSKRTWR